MKLGLLCAFFLAITCCNREHFSVEASGAIKKVPGIRNRKNSFDVTDESSEISFPKEGRCKAIGRLN